MQNIGQFLIFFWNIWNKTRDQCKLSARDKSWDGALGAGWKNIGQFLQCRLFYDWPLFCGEINSVLSFLKDYKKLLKSKCFLKYEILKKTFIVILKKFLWHNDDEKWLIAINVYYNLLHLPTQQLTEQTELSQSFSLAQRLSTLSLSSAHRQLFMQMCFCIQPHYARQRTW